MSRRWKPPGPSAPGARPGAAFKAFKGDVDTGAYPEAKRLVGIEAAEFNAFLRALPK